MKQIKEFTYYYKEDVEKYPIDRNLSKEAKYWIFILIGLSLHEFGSHNYGFIPFIVLMSLFIILTRRWILK